MSRLIGAAPGYVGFEEGGKAYTIFVFPDTNLNLGQLTEAVRRKPYGTYLSNPYSTFQLIVIFSISCVVIRRARKSTQGTVTCLPFSKELFLFFGLGCCDDTSANTR